MSLIGKRKVGRLKVTPLYGVIKDDYSLKTKEQRIKKASFLFVSNVVVVIWL